jgi:hypothetical protein
LIKKNIKEEILKIHEIFTNLNYPKCPEKLEKINLDNLLNNKKMKSKEIHEIRNENDYDYDLNIITSHSFNKYSVHSTLNKIKYFKTLKEEKSKLEINSIVNTPSSDNIKQSDVLITEDLDSLIKGVKSMPVIPKLQQIVPIINKASNVNDDNHVNKKKKRSKRKRKNERKRRNNEYKDEDGNRSPKSRKINNSNKNWDDITIEESQYFDIEDKENSFETILNQYNSMKQLPKDILVINQILNEPKNDNKNNENDNNPEVKVTDGKRTTSESNKNNALLSGKKIKDTYSLNEKGEMLPSNKIEIINLNNESIPESNDNTNTMANKRENDNISLKLKEKPKKDIKVNEDLSDIWNKNSPISTTSSNASVSNMSDEESNFNSTLDNHKNHKLEILKYKSILTPPTPPQPLEEN